MVLNRSRLPQSPQGAFRPTFRCVSCCRRFKIKEMGFVEPHGRMCCDCVGNGAQQHSGVVAILDAVIRAVKAGRLHLARQFSQWASHEIQVVGVEEPAA